MDHIIREKLMQASSLVAESGADVWLTFVRETAESGDPVLPLLVEGALTWQSALLVGRDGRRIAIVGNYDADPLLASGNWDDVVTYVQGIRQPLIETLDRMIPAGGRPRIAVNYSTNDVKADGLSHGMYLLLEQYLSGTRFEGCLESGEEIVMRLRGRKSPAEIERMRGAIAETDRLFDDIAQFARPGFTELQVYDFVQKRIEERGLGYAWGRSGDPIVNSGPDSMIGHGRPSADIRIAPGHILHADLGVVRDGYSSDIQRCWYVRGLGDQRIPDDVERATQAVVKAIDAGAAALRPGVEGWQVDAAARSYLVGAGYAEFLHAFGHQVGRMAHDGGAILGPKWERYGRTPTIPIGAGEVYTLELGVVLEGRGYLGLEEMAAVTESGIEWLTDRQVTMRLLSHV